ncbi:MAG: hypothetical protein EXQ52_18935 [Bryobacterales bacterium]|nr:hypothetical protein [Bryobacterales bacterium]
MTDPDSKDLIAAAVNLAKAGRYEASRKAFEQFAEKAPVAAVYNNIGALNNEQALLLAAVRRWLP